MFLIKDLRKKNFRIPGTPKWFSITLTSLGPSGTLPIRVLAMKATILLALATFLRVSEIASIDFSSVKQSDTRIVFSLSELRKWQRTGSLQSFSLKFLEDDLICPARTILEYIRRTAHVRGNCTFLFISTVSPYKAVTSSTISHWIKESLSKSGVYSNFSALIIARSKRRAIGLVGEE